jgi:hypothetical protein
VRHHLETTLAACEGFTVTVYQFKRYDITIDGWQISRRWGTREAIVALGSGFEILESTAAEVAEADVQSDIPGLTKIGFNPHWHNGAQRQV